MTSLVRSASVAVVACVLAALGAFWPGSAEARSAKAVNACSTMLEEEYGATEVTKAIERRGNGRRWIHATAVLQDGRTVRYRCMVSYGTVRRVDIRGNDWGVAPKIAKEEKPVETETAAAPAETPEEEAEADKDGSPETEGEAERETEGEADGAGQPAEGEAAAAAAGTADQADPDEPERTNTAKRYLIGVDEGYSPQEGVTCYRDRQACYDADNRLNLQVTASEFQ